ncbi:MAG: PKD domain-containing protein [Bacteroidetes bacterium]|nr:PKD domain-containing protein [Bacteroidota bacterium]
MNKIFTKQILLVLISIFLILTVVIISCKKPDESNNSLEDSNKLAPFYSKNLIASFKQEPIAQEFLREISRVPIRIVNGMLSFNSVEDFNKTYDLLIEYTDRYDELAIIDQRYSIYAESEQMPEDIMLYLFESHLRFNSLRADIEEQYLILQQRDGISETNNPDNHYILSSYKRALLSPECEVIIDDLICIYYDTYGIGIMNNSWTTLKELHETQRQNNFDEIKALEFCSGNPNAFFLTTDGEPSLHVDFTFVPDPIGQNTIQFINYSSSEAYKNMEFFWDFGDGVTSTEKNPTHTFLPGNGGGSACLTVTVPSNNGNNHRAQTVTTCIPVPKPNDPPSNSPTFTYTANEGTVSFTCTHPPQSQVSRYVWQFGDGAEKTELYSNKTTHTYIAAKTYSVRLTVYYHDGSFGIAVRDDIKVTSVKNCCKRNDYREKYHYYNNNNNRLLLSIRAYNVYPCHRIYAKTIHYEKNSAGNYKTKKVDVIEAGYYGLIYKKDGGNGLCGTEHNSTAVWLKSKTNAYRVMLDRGLGTYNPYYVSKKSLHSWHFVKDGGVVKFEGQGTSVHDEDCN